MWKVRDNGIMSPEMASALNSTQAIRKQRTSLFWGFVNATLFSVLVYDMMYTCPLYSDTFKVVEALLTAILGINMLFHFIRYFWTTNRFEPIIVTPLQKRLLGFRGGEPFVQVQENPTLPIILTPDNCPPTPCNLSPSSWLSSPANTSISEFDDSKMGLNSSLPSAWTYVNGSQQKPKPTNHAIRKLNLTTIGASTEDIINDELSLSQYLKDYIGHEKSSTASYSMEQPSNLLSMFWSHPVARSPSEATPMLRKCAYQIALASSEQTTNTIRSSDEPGLSSPCDAEIWRRNKINSNNVIQWTANLRMWISQTILERLVSEVKSINVALQLHGFVDICIGEVGLDRLRKTAQTPQIVQNIPSLPCLVPFLEISPNQEYIVARIKELTKGGCMSEFKWNSGGFLDGKEWGEHLPTDAALILHLWATYLDSQLPPLPSMPDSRPFSSLYLIKHPNKSAKVPLAICQLTENPPHFQLVTGEEVHYIPKGRNNLFHTILLFLHHIKKNEHGMLGRMNLGRSGINMLWIIES